MSALITLIEGRKMRLALSAWLLLCAAAIKSGGYNYLSLAAHADFNAYCDWTEIILNLALLVPVFAAVAFAGRRAMRLLGLESGLALDFFCGVALFNICLLPFFFAGLAYRGVVLALLLAFLLFGDSGVSWPRLPQSRLWSALVLLALGWSSLHYVFNAMAPVSLGESQGDVAGGYMAVDIFFAQHHGAASEIALGPHLFVMQQYAVLGSALASLSNPGLVKLFGLALMLSMALGIFQFLEARLPRWAAFAAACLFLSTPVLGNSSYFSLAHDRLYLMFMNFFVFLLIVEGHSRKEFRYHALAVASCGLMFAVSMAGVIYAACALAAILLASPQWRAVKKQCLLALLAFAALASVFPLWHWSQTGCIFPGNPFFIKLFGASGNDYIMNDFVSERVGQFYMMRTSSDLDSLVLFPFTFAFANMGLAAALFFAGFAFLRQPEVRLMYAIVLFQLYILLPLFPNMLLGGVAARFVWPSLPLLWAASFYFLGLWLERLRQGRAR